MFSSKFSNILHGSHKALKHSKKAFSTYEEVRIPVPWGYIAGKWWGPRDKRPILALHGWQDNCATFDRLVKHMPQNLGFLAIDLPGHGLSSHLPPGIFYEVMNNTVLIKRLLDYFQWRKVSLLGHSLGAITGYLYTLLYPNSVDFLVCLDSFQPHLPRNNPVKNLTQIFDDFLKYDEFYTQGKEPPSYTMEEIVSRVYIAMQKALKLEYCHYVIQRNVKPSSTDPTKYYFARDSRTKPNPLFLWGVQDIIETAHNIVCPAIFCKCSGSPYYDSKPLFEKVAEIVKKTSKDFQFHVVPGTHYMHLNNPEVVEDLIRTFVAKHDIEDRQQTCIENIIVK